MAKRYSQYIKIVNVIIDFAMMNFSYILAFKLKLGAFHSPFLSMLMYVNLSWLCLILVFKPYKVSRVTSVYNVIGNYLGIIFLHVLLTFGFYVIQISHQYSRELLTIMYSILLTVLLGWKVLFFLSLKSYRRKGFNYRSVVVVHKKGIDSGVDVVMRRNPEYGYKLVKEFFVDTENHETINDELIAFCEENKVDEIFYSIASLKYGKMIQLVRFAEEHFIKFNLVGDFKGFMFRGFEIQNFGHVPLLKIISMPLDDVKNRIIKRAFDVVFSLAVIIFIASWLFPILAILIKLDSRGKVFFKQKRTGKSNQPFWCLKFRTMVDNAQSDQIQATENDKRVTRLGAFLRKTSLDELPQFFNVLVGDMSVVGPRPHMLKHTEDYTEDVDQFMIRHSIKPGVTGLAQAKGYRGEIKVQADKTNRVKLDNFYVRNWSFYFDFVIIMQTLFSLIKKEHKVY